MLRPEIAKVGTGQTDNGPIGRTVLQTVAQKQCIRDFYKLLL